MPRLHKSPRSRPTKSRTIAEALREAAAQCTDARVRGWALRLVSSGTREVRKAA
jgi:hypothetical protein